MVFMDPDGSLQIQTGPYRSGQVLRVLDSSLLIRTGSYSAYGSEGVLIFHNGSLWIQTGPNGSELVLMDTDGSLWIWMGCYGSKWVLMDEDGSV